MKLNDFNTLLIKIDDEELTDETEEIIEDLGDSVYIYKNNN